MSAADYPTTGDCVVCGFDRELDWMGRCEGCASHEEGVAEGAERAAGEIARLRASLDAALARAEEADAVSAAAYSDLAAIGAVLDGDPSPPCEEGEVSCRVLALRQERDEALRSARISEAGRLAAEKVAQEDDQFLPLYEALAQVKALRGALERIIAIEAECPTWWDDPTVGVGAVARAALSTTPVAALEAHDGRVARSALEHAAGIPWIGKPPASPWGEVQSWLLHLAAAIECDEE